MDSISNRNKSFWIVIMYAARKVYELISFDQKGTGVMSSAIQFRQSKISTLENNKTKILMLRGI